MGARWIEVELRDARAALREWWEAIQGSAENPIVLLGQRQRTPLTTTQRLVSTTGWGGLLLVMLWAGQYVATNFFAQVSSAYRPTLTIALVLLGWLTVWIGFGLFDAAVFAIKLISSPRTVSRGEFEIDETLQASRISDRELTVGLALLVLPRMLARVAFGPLVAMGAIVLWQLRNSAQEAGAANEMAQVLHEHFSLQSMFAHMPLAIALMAVCGLLASITLVLWLMTLGRGVRLDWQMHLLAGSVTLVQLAWIPIAVWRMTARPSFLSHSRVELGDNSLAPFFAFLAVPAFLAWSLHMARRRPFFRLAAAALLPPLGLALWCTLPHPVSDGYITLPPGTIWLEEQLRYFGALVLVNPLALSYPRLLGLDGYAVHWFAMFGWYRLPLLLLLQLTAIAICAHAARLAIRDWRTAED